MNLPGLNDLALPRRPRSTFGSSLRSDATLRGSRTSCGSPTCISRCCNRLCGEGRRGTEPLRLAVGRGGVPCPGRWQKLKVARALLADPSLSVSEVAAQLDAAPSTLHRSFPSGRSGSENWCSPCLIPSNRCRFRQRVPNPASGGVASLQVRLETHPDCASRRVSSMMEAA